MCTAFVNLATPTVIGQLVNVLSRFIPAPMDATDPSARAWSQLLHDINRPAIRLVGLFAAQGM